MQQSSFHLSAKDFVQKLASVTCHNGQRNIEEPCRRFNSSEPKAVVLGRAISLGLQYWTRLYEAKRKVPSHSYGRPFNGVMSLLVSCNYVWLVQSFGAVRSIYEAFQPENATKGFEDFAYEIPYRWLFASEQEFCTLQSSDQRWWLLHAIPSSLKLVWPLSNSKKGFFWIPRSGCGKFITATKRLFTLP